MSDNRITEPTDVGSDPPVVEDLIDDLDDLATDAESEDVQAEIRETKDVLAVAQARGLLDSGLRRLQPSDAAEAFVGSVIFASPLLVEDGIFDIANYLFGFTVSGVPVFLVANTLFVVLVTYALVEWTGRNKEEANRLLNVVPARVVMILVVSSVVAAVLMTVWGRVGDWQPPTEAIARINVVWTVGSLGAALGDILSEGDSSTVVAESSDGKQRAPETTGLSDGALVETLHEQFTTLRTVVDDQAKRSEIQQIGIRTQEAAVEELFGRQIRKYTTRDIAEAFVGSIFFSIPFLVEDGVFDVAAYFLSFRVDQFPVFFVVNAAFVLLMVSALVYWSGPQTVEVSRPLFGVIPRRLVGIAVVSFLTTAALMTMWGRVGNWQNPGVAVARISVVWTVASFGAALGDILPGESSGDDINEDLAEFGDRVEDLVDRDD